jgi:peroxiredoxin
MLPAVDGTGTVSLADYRGKSSVLLGLFIGLWCPFCRRAIAQMSLVEDQLKAAGVETLGVVATQPDNARLYFKYRPIRLRLAADPELTTHRAYGLPQETMTPELIKTLEATRINPSGELPEPLPIPEAMKTLGNMDKYAPTDTDRADMKQQGGQLKGQFLIDRQGIVRWADIECTDEGPAGLGKLPTPDEILAAARTLPRI